MPYDVGTSQIQHAGVDGFHRQRFRFHHQRCVTQGGFKAVIFDIDQCAIGRNWRQIEQDLGNKGQRSFRTTQQTTQIQRFCRRIVNVSQIVTGQETVQLREGCFDIGTFTTGDIPHQTIDFAFAILLCQFCLQRFAT